MPLAASHLHRANGQRYLILIFDRGPLNNNAAVTMALLEFLVEIGIFDFAMAVLLQVLHSTATSRAELSESKRQEGAQLTSNCFFNPPTDCLFRTCYNITIRFWGRNCK